MWRLKLVLHQKRKDNTRHSEIRKSTADWKQETSPWALQTGGSELQILNKQKHLKELLPQKKGREGNICKGILSSLLSLQTDNNNLPWELVTISLVPGRISSNTRTPRCVKEKHQHAKDKKKIRASGQKRELTAIRLTEARKCLGEGRGKITQSRILYSRIIFQEWGWNKNISQMNKNRAHHQQTLTKGTSKVWTSGRRKWTPEIRSLMQEGMASKQTGKHVGKSKQWFYKTVSHVWIWK